MHLGLISSSVTILGKTSLLKMSRSFQENSSVCKRSKTCLHHMVRKLKYSGTMMLIEVQWGHVSHSSKFEFWRGRGGGNLVTLLGGKLTINLWTTYVTDFLRFQILKTWTFGLIAYDAVQPGRCLLSFRTELLPAYSEKNNFLKTNLRTVATP